MGISSERTEPIESWSRTARDDSHHSNRREEPKWSCIPPLSLLLPRGDTVPKKFRFPAKGRYVRFVSSPIPHHSGRDRSESQKRHRLLQATRASPHGTPIRRTPREEPDSPRTTVNAPDVHRETAAFLRFCGRDLWEDTDDRVDRIDPVEVATPGVRGPTCRSENPGASPFS